MLTFDPASLAPDARHSIGRAPLAGASAQPVLSLQTFATGEEPLAPADHPTDGICADAYTRDLALTLRVMQRIEAGTLSINRYGRSRNHILPTGGCKASGPGKDRGSETCRANCRSKRVLIDIQGEAA